MAIVMLISSSCHSAGELPQLDESEVASRCLDVALPREVMMWLREAPAIHPGERVEEWAIEVQRGIPSALLRLFDEVAARVKVGTPLADLNTYHSRILDHFSSASRGLATDRCLATLVASDMLLAQVVSRLGAEVRGSGVQIQSGFERTPYGGYYSGNLLLVWLMLRSAGEGVPMTYLLQQYEPRPGEDKIFR